MRLTSPRGRTYRRCRLGEWVAPPRPTTRRVYVRARRVHAWGFLAEDGCGRLGGRRRGAVGDGARRGTRGEGRESADAASAHRDLVPGEPLVRPLLRLCAAGAGGRVWSAARIHAARRIRR